MKRFASRKWHLVSALFLLGAVALAPFCATPAGEPNKADDVRTESIVRKRYAMEPPHHSKDPAVKIDYDIVYVRAPRNAFVYPDVGTPTLVEPGADLMLLHPDGSEERLVEGGKRGSVADPFVSFDGNTVSSRRIGNKLYLVLQQPMRVWGDPHILQKTGGIVPQFEDSRTGKTVDVAPCSRIAIFPHIPSPEYMTVAAIPVDLPSSDVKTEERRRAARRVLACPQIRPI